MYSPMSTPILYRSDNMDSSYWPAVPVNDGRNGMDMSDCSDYYCSQSPVQPNYLSVGFDQNSNVENNNNSPSDYSSPNSSQHSPLLSSSSSFYDIGTLQSDSIVQTTRHTLGGQNGYFHPYNHENSFIYNYDCRNHDLDDATFTEEEKQLSTAYLPPDDNGDSDSSQDNLVIDTSSQKMEPSYSQLSVSSEFNQISLQGISTSSQTYGPSLSPPSDYPSKYCQVCGDKSTGRHYNAFTCEGCKGFFRRSVMKQMQYICKSSNNDCVVTTHNRRRSCRACRFQRCIRIGMNPEICLNKIGADYLDSLSGHSKAENLYHHLPRIFRESFSQFMLPQQHESLAMRKSLTKYSSDLNNSKSPNPYIIVDFLDFYVRVCSSLITFVSKFEFFESVSPSVMWKVIHDRVSYFASCLFIACYWSSSHYSMSDIQLPFIPQLHTLSLTNLEQIIPNAISNFQEMISCVHDLTSSLVYDLPHAIFTSFVKNLNELNGSLNSEINECQTMMNEKRWNDCSNTWDSFSKLISDSHQVGGLFKNIFIDYEI